MRAAIPVTLWAFAAVLPCQGAEPPLTGLKLWLKADAGVVLNGSTISQWSDQSGFNTHASQAVAGRQPLYTVNAVGGRPAIQFDGVDDFLTFNLPLNGLTGVSLFLVSASDANVDGGNAGAARAPLFWNETAWWGTVYLSPFQRYVPFRFGTGAPNNMPMYTRPTSVGSAFSLTSAIHSVTTDSLWVNGTAAVQVPAMLAALNGIDSVGNLGRGYNNDTYFTGKIAEVLVYARALTDAERQQVEQYLTQKYALGNPVNQAPSVSAGPDLTVTLPASANLNGTVTDDGLPTGTLTIGWSKASGPGTVTFANASSAATTATFSATGSYILRLTGSDGLLSATDDVTVTVNASNGSMPTQDLKLWLKADAGVVLNGSLVSQWTDQSGSNTNATQALAAQQPFFLASAVAGKPAIQFDGASDFLSFNLPLNGLTGLSLFLVSAGDAAVDGGAVGAARSALFWNESGWWGTAYLSPFPNSINYRFGTGQPNNMPLYTRPVSIGGAFSLTTAIHNGTTDSLWINGTAAAQETGKVAMLANIDPIGNLGRGYNNDTYFPGKIAEVLVYARALSDPERQQLEQYLIQKYSLGTSTNQAPVVSAGPDVTVTLPTPATLNGSVSDDGLPNGTVTSAWSKISGAGTVTFTNAALPVTTASFSAAGTYVLRLSGSDGVLASTDDVTVTVNASSGPVPMQDLKLWLRADAGVVLNGSNVSQWTDQSGSNTHASQPVAGQQPLLLATAAGGKPALQFDGVSDFLTFNLPLNGLTGLTLILVSAADAAVDGGTVGAARSALFWNESGWWGTAYLSPFRTSVSYRFGTGQAGNVPLYTRPASIGGAFSLTTAIHNGATDSLWINGTAVAQLTGRLATLANIDSTGNLGRGYNNDTYFPGKIAEVLVYARALSDPERQQVEQYLIQKYSVGTVTNQAPVVGAGPDMTVTLPTPAMLNGSVSDDGLPNGTLTSAWSKISGPGTVTFSDAASPVTSASFSAAGSYVLRLSGSDGALTGTDDVAVTVNAASGPVPTQDLKLWLKGDAGVVLNGSAVSQWTDQSGSNTHASQPVAGQQPLFLAGAAGGKPALQFDGVGDFFTFSLPLNGLTGLSLFLVSAGDADADGGTVGAARSALFWNESGWWGTAYLSPFRTSISYRFGTGQAGNIPLYMRPGSIGNNFSLTTAIHNGTTDSLWVNGAAVAQLTGRLATLANIDATGNLGRGYNNDTYFPGKIAEVLVYARALSDAERQQVEQYLIQKYTLGTATNQAPVVSAGSDLTVTLPAAASLNGTVADDGMPSGTLTIAWSKVSGPGTVTFANPASVSTTATFSAAGSYVLRLSGSDGVLTGTDDVTVTVSGGDTTAPTISQIGTSSVGPTSVTVTWKTDEPADSQVDYGLTVSYGSSTTLNSSLVTDHTVVLSGLAANTPYHFRVRSKDASGNGAVSGDNTVQAAGSSGWWNTGWHYRLPVTVSAGAYDRYDRPIEFAVNFTTVLASLGVSAAFAESSLRVVEVDSSGAIVDAAVPFQFDKDAAYNASTRASGTVVWLMQGTTAANGQRRYHIYFDTAAKTPASVSALVNYTDNVSWQGQASYRIGTRLATYYYHKQGGGFASMFDLANTDWISYRPTGGSAGNYRGIPNMISPESEFHPGSVLGSSQVLQQGPIHLQIQSVTNDGLWQGVWDIFPDYMRFTLLKKGHDYWFLYEGTPGGSITSSDYYMLSNGTTAPLTQDFSTDLPNPEWIAFGSEIPNRLLYLAKHADDTILDQFFVMENNMTVFGFGREYKCCGNFLTDVPAKFTVGFTESSAFGTASKRIYSSYRDLSVTAGTAQLQ